MSKKILYKIGYDGYGIGIYSTLIKDEDVRSFTPKELGDAYIVYNPIIEDLSTNVDEGTVIICGESSISETYATDNKANVSNKNVFIQTRTGLLYGKDVIGIRKYNINHGLLILDSNKFSRPLKLNLYDDVSISAQLPEEFRNNDVIYFSDINKPQQISSDVCFKIKTTNTIKTFSNIDLNRGRLEFTDEDESYSIRHGLGTLDSEQLIDDITAVIHNAEDNINSKFFVYNPKEKSITFTLKRYKLVLAESRSDTK